MTSQKEGVKSDNITSWHAAVFFQVFALIIWVMLPIWYAVVLISPGSVSEHLPPEPGTVTVATFSEILPFTVIWALVLYFTLKRKQIALLASIAYSVSWLILLPVYFVTGGTSPDFSDFVFFPTVILLVVFSAMAYKSFPRKIA
jgi:peptidoglycan/LPS O-acetylase OafA/YrhL